MTIHATDPFATPDDARSPLRRLRARLPAAVTLWTARGPEDRPAGLTVSSTMLAEPGTILGLIDDESDLYTAVQHSGRFALTVLADGDDQLADRFAGLLPAPGGLFSTGTWEHTEFGPVKSGRQPWVGCTVASTRRVGYAMLIEGTVTHLSLHDGPPPLVRYRGRYTRLTP